jgi:thiosulfate/3-mercaptopyruvate sulfurtransferase
MKTLMDVPTLRDRMTSGARTVVLDVRWTLGDRDGRKHYREGHVPGAVFVDLETGLAAPGGHGLGRHPLPEPAAFEESAREWGINRDDTVVVYDDAGGQSAARLWWLLRDGGFESVFLLDGGLAAWRQEGLELERGEEQPCLGNVHLEPGHMEVLLLDDVAGFAADGVLLDARAGERYRGESEPVDPKAGHIPGALSAPTTGNLGADGRFLTADELAARFHGIGVRADQPVAVYCGSGVSAAHEIAALAEAGIAAALFPGSWSQWSQLGRPAATGDEPYGKRADEPAPADGRSHADSKLAG